MHEQLLNHLKNTRLYYESTDEAVDNLLGILDSFPNIELYIINSNLSKIETININSKSYIIWDENYWEHYYKYLALMCSKDVYNDDATTRFCSKETYYHERLIWLESIFLSLLAERYDTCLSISATLHNETSFKTYDLFETVFAHEEAKGEHNHLVLPMRISKMFAELHEISHVIIKKERDLNDGAKWLDIIKSTLMQMLKHIDSFCKVLHVEDEQKNKYINFINELLTNEDLSYLEELASDFLALTYAKQLIFDQHDLDIEIINVFYQTLLIYTQFNWQINTIFEYWNIYYFCIFNDELKIKKLKNNRAKKDRHFTHYFNQLQFPYISNQKIILPVKRFNRLKDIDMENSFRFGFFNIALYYMLRFPTTGDKCDGGQNVLSINADILEMFSYIICLTLLNDNYISSRILNAKRLNKPENIDNAKILKQFKNIWTIS